MPDLTLVAVGAIALVVGLVGGWVLASARARPSVAKEVAESKVRDARAVEHLKQSVAADIERKERELEDLRGRLEQEHLTTAKTQAEVKHAVDQKSRLSAELQTVVDDSFREVGQFYEISSTLEKALQVYTQAVESMEARLLDATKRLRELGISAGTPLSVSAMSARDASGLEQRPSVEPAGPVTEAADTATEPAPVALPMPFRTNSAVSTKRTSPGVPGRPRLPR